MAAMQYDLYVITDEAISGGRSHADIARQAVEGGADVIQLRDKAIGGRALLSAALGIREITRQSGALFIVNDRLDIALASGADGVHLGQDDMPASVVRQLAPPGFLIGVSVGSVAEALVAVSDGADYIAVSPVFPTPSKDDAARPAGLEGVKDIRHSVSLPLVAIGGIGLHNVAEVIGSGADGIAVISAVVGKPDIASAAKELKEAVSRAKEEGGP